MKNHSLILLLLASMLLAWPSQAAQTSDPDGTTPTGILTVPVSGAADVKADGDLTEAVWKDAASLPVLVNLKPDDTFLAPEGLFLLNSDEKNLYLGLNYIIPADNAVVVGQLRTDDFEPDVWGSESFEFYLQIGKELYRFSGNVAGGYAEAKNLFADWNCPWEYGSQLRMQLNDSRLWQAEAVIPWTSLGLQGPPADDIHFAFCRTWCLPAFSGATSVAHNGEYSDTNAYPALRFRKDAVTMRRILSDNPSHGMLHQVIGVSATADAHARYEVALSDSRGAAKPQVVASREIDLKAGENAELDVKGRIATASFDRLRFTLYSGDEAMAQCTVPFKMKEVLFDVHPHFLGGSLSVEMSMALLKDMFGQDFEPYLALVSPSGQLVQRAAAKGDVTAIPFDKNGEAGLYKVSLQDKDGNDLSTADLNFPGIGDWARGEELFPRDVIIPPFTPLVTKAGDNAADFSMWGRTYAWEGGLLPSRITSQGEALLDAPVALVVNGKPLPKGTFAMGESRPHRAEFTASAANKDCSATMQGWIEYDGVNYNTIHLKAARKISSVKVEVRIPRSQAQFLHTSHSLSWGHKITARITDGFNQPIDFYSVVWIGEYEKGLCVFTETDEGWTNKRPSVISVADKGDDVVLTFEPFVNLKAGEEKDLELGFLASPVRPLPPNYPLNTFADSHQAYMNRPGRRPTTDIMLSFAGGSTSILGGFFCDIPDKEHSVNGPFVKPTVDAIHEGGGRAVPYLLCRMLSEEYPEITAYKDVWSMVPGNPLDYERNGVKYVMPEGCPATDFSAFHALKIAEYIRRFPTEGIYFDYGLIGFCNNALHGHTNRIPLLALREFYRRVILVQLDAGIKDPVIVLHNTDSVQLPAFTFATHLFNGEHIRQHSSNLMHDGKDILDSYGIEMFASELSSLPFGLTNSVYEANDVLLPEFGGDPNEDPELYKFRVTKAIIAGAIVHGTMVSPSRCHFGYFDKIVRAYDAFDVPNAQFIGYWRHPVQVAGAKNVYVSAYRKDGRCLLVVSHIGKEHIKQTCTLKLDLPALGMKGIGTAVEHLTADDPEYEELYTLMANTKLPPNITNQTDIEHIFMRISGAEHQRMRTPLKWGDPGVKLLGFTNDTVTLELDFHSFALIELAE